VGVAGQAQLDIQRMHAGTATTARHQEGPQIGDRTATGLEGPWCLRVGQTITPRPDPGRVVQPVMPASEQQLDQHTPQRSQEFQEGVLELEEGGRCWIAQASGDGRVELAVELWLQLVDSRWTSRGRGANLALAHGGGLLIVPIWGVKTSGQDKSPEPQNH